jgi:hypothetical protein
MGFLEIMGVIALWVLGTIIALYAAAIVIGRMKGGLEVVALMNWVLLAIIAVSVLGGVFVIGGLILP